MPIIHKYITKGILYYFSLIVVIVISVFLMVDFFERFDNFMENGTSMARVGAYFIFRIPFVITLISPFGILLSVIVMFGLMVRNNEITALKSGGVSIYYLLSPALWVGIFISVGLFFFSEAIAPAAAAKANAIWLEDVKKKPAIVIKDKDLWIKGKNSISNIEYFDLTTGIAHGVTKIIFDENSRLIQRIDAEKGEYLEGGWLLENIMEQTLIEAEGRYAVKIYKNGVFRLGFAEKDLSRVVKRPDEMNFFELSLYIRKIEADGYDVTSLKVDLFGKTAFPFLCFIMCLIGTGVSFTGRARDSLPLITIYGIGIAFFYWITYSFCMALGYGKMLHPFAAAWIANFIFLCAGGLLILYVE